MATAAVTNTFIADTPAEAAEVNQNFTDVLTFLNNSVVHKDGTVAMTGALAMGSQKVTGLGTPTASTDAATKGYVDTSVASAVAGVGGVPAGVIAATAASTAPTGWLLCQGQNVSRTTYPTLFAAIGTNYGSGDGSTTFGLPNLKGKVPVGLDNSDTSFDALAETGGSKDAIVVAHTHDVSGSTNTTGSHTHSDAFRTTTAGATSGSSVNANIGTGTTTTGSGGSHSHTVTGTAASTGSSGTNANLQPYLVVNYIICTGE